jgi:hypothetical protein
MCVKRKYDKRGAETALNLILGRLKGYQNRKEKRMYFCMLCDGWHLTSMEEASFEVETEEIQNDQFKKYLQQ